MAKKPDPKDWHKADIKAALHRLGKTFKQLAIENGYRSVDACSQALHRPYPKAERIVAAAIGVKPEEIWPSRYITSSRYIAKSSKADCHMADKTH